MASLDAQQYAEALRKSLMEDLFNGEELDDDSSDQQQSTLTLQGMDESSQAQQQVCLASTQQMRQHDVTCCWAGTAICSCRKPVLPYPNADAEHGSASTEHTYACRNIVVGPAAYAPCHNSMSSLFESQLSALESELEEFAGHEVIRAILEQGMVIQQHSADVGGRLRSLELESIQDYIAESDNLVALHEQVCAGK
jgi:hypothetical protein